jgi:benzodiazapine receptor
MYEYFPILVVILIVLLSILSMENSKQWYKSLKKSPANPPPVVFSIAWTILYVLLILVWIKVNKTQLGFDIILINWVFFIFFIFSLSWCYIFFLLKNFLLGMIIIICMIIVLAFLIYLLKRDTFSIVSLSLTMAWLVFALYLNSYIYAKNHSLVV